MKSLSRSITKPLFVLFCILFLNATLAYSSASVSLRWDANVPAPEGYRVFAREAGDSYDYAHPIWENSLTTCTLTGLTEGVTYYFVVRAYEGDLESVDSEEVSYTPPLADTGSNTGSDDSGDATDADTGMDANTDIDSDGDNVVDSQDAFPNNAEEWADSDSDGIGNNLDADDDNDGMTDDWEAAHGSDPLVDDADLDADGDGVSNLDEYYADLNVTTPSDDHAPAAPVVESALTADRVSLTPVLVCGAYFDSDDDAHFQTRWQISTDADFTTLVLDAISTTQLYAYTVGEMVLDADTVYYWRAQFTDTDNQASDWSETATFTTIAIENAGDADLDGILDVQEADQASDVNENGIADGLEDNIMTVNTVEGQRMVGVETMSDTVTLVSVKSLSTEGIADRSINLGFGLVGFKLYLDEGVTTASVKIHFSTQVPEDAKLYKYSIETGWQEYENAVFAANRKSVTLVLEDGGVGDEDGVQNGVIVDPSGIAYNEEAETSSGDSASLSDTTAASGSGSGGACFISAGTDGLNTFDAGYAIIAVLLSALLLTLGAASVTAVRVRNK